MACSHIFGGSCTMMLLCVVLRCQGWSYIPCSVAVLVWRRACFEPLMGHGCCGRRSRTARRHAPMKSVSFFSVQPTTTTQVRTKRTNREQSNFHPIKSGRSPTVSYTGSSSKPLFDPPHKNNFRRWGRRPARPGQARPYTLFDLMAIEIDLSIHRSIGTIGVKWNARDQTPRIRPADLYRS